MPAIAKPVSEIILSIEHEIIESLPNYDSFWNKVQAITKIVTPKIEELYVAWPGANKKVEATKVINALIDAHLKVPFWAKPFQGFIVSKVIDSVVALFNRTGVFKHS